MRDHSLVRPTPQRLLRRAVRKLPAREAPTGWASGLYNVSISHRMGFIWFRVAKAGTRSVLAALEEGDAGQVDRHLSGAVLPSWVFGRYTAWAVVRDPADRLESCWRDKVRLTNRWDLDPDRRSPSGFVDWVAGQDLGRCDRHLRLQSALVDLRRAPLIGRIETFEEDLERIFGRLGLPFHGAPVENRTRTVEASEWTSRLRDRARAIYARDCEAFGY